MIEFIFTIDYEIYGNGEGSLRDLIYEPMAALVDTFQKWKAPLVTFVEAAELEMIEANRTDPAIDLVKNQIRDLYTDGFEIGLHLHPQWYNGYYHEGRWHLDYREYNLCILPKERIAHILDRSIAYLRRMLGSPDFTPLSFRAGNWLLQPTRTVAEPLHERGIRVDSSVFKGGLQRQHKLDYRRTLSHGHYWMFETHVDVPDPNGALLELPIFTQMVPLWKMPTSKRISLQRKGCSHRQSAKGRLYRVIDLLRFRHPLKLDFCRMTTHELTSMIDIIVKEDQRDPATFRPIVAIGHTKDLVEFSAIERFLYYLEMKGIKVSTINNVYHRYFTSSTTLHLSPASKTDYVDH